MGQYKKMSFKLLGDCWIINMIHWSWQPLVLKELLFPNTLQLNAKKTIRPNMWKRGNLNLHIIISCLSCYHNKSKINWLFHFSFRFHNSEENVKMCTFVNHSKVIITFFLLKKHASTSILSTKLKCSFYYLRFLTENKTINMF